MLVLVNEMQARTKSLDPVRGISLIFAASMIANIASTLTSSLVHVVNRFLLELPEERKVERTLEYFLGGDK